MEAIVRIKRIGTRGNLRFALVVRGVEQAEQYISRREVEKAASARRAQVK